MAEPYGDGHESVTISEHISPRKTGDNIEAKRVAGYVFNPTTLEWQRDTNIAIATEATLQDMITQLGLMLDSLQFGQLTDNAKRLKVTLAESGALPLVTTVSTVTAVTTVGTVTNQARIGDIQAQRMVEAMLDVSFSTGITNNLSL